MKKDSTLFTSVREKRYWSWALVVLVAIFSTLFMSRPLTYFFMDQDVQVVVFVLGLLLIASTVLVHGLKKSPGRIELTVLLGIVAVYILLAFRLGAPERSHLIEYSVLAILLHKAIAERGRHRKLPINSALLAAACAFFFGIFDEVLQLILPNRVFDLRDIAFNGIAVILAIGSSRLLEWLNERVNKST